MPGSSPKHGKKSKSKKKKSGGKSKSPKKSKDGDGSKKRKRHSQSQGQQKYFRVLEQMMEDDPSWALSDLLTTLKSAFSSSLGGGLPRNFPSDEQIRSHYKNNRRKATTKSPTHKKIKRSPPTVEITNKYLLELRKIIAVTRTDELGLNPIRDRMLAAFNLNKDGPMPDDFPSNATISRRINYAKKKREKQPTGDATLSLENSHDSIYSEYIRELVEQQPKIKFAMVKAKVLEKFTLPDGSLPKDFPTIAGLSSRTAYTRRQFKTEKKAEFFEFIKVVKTRNDEIDLDTIAALLKQPFKGYQTKDFLQESDVNEVLEFFRDKLPKMNKISSDSQSAETPAETKPDQPVEEVESVVQADSSETPPANNDITTAPSEETKIDSIDGDREDSSGQEQPPIAERDIESPGAEGAEEAATPAQGGVSSESVKEDPLSNGKVDHSTGAADQETQELEERPGDQVAEEGKKL